MTDGTPDTPGRGDRRDGPARERRARPTRERPRRRQGPRSATLPQILASAVEANPDGLALVADEGTWTYRQLDEESSQLARELMARGIGAESVVALAITRSARSILSVWAVAKTGAAYVPVDPNYPPDRIEFMLSDSGAALGLTVGAHRGEVPESLEWIVLDDPAVADAVAAQSAAPVTYADRLTAVSPGNVAYMIYTSGSTGRPKGVEVTHAGLASLAAEQRERYGIDRESRTLAVASPSFDASVFELLMAIGSGATLVVSPADVFGGDALTALMREQRVTHAVITPSVLASVDPEQLPDLKSIVTAGEACPPELVTRFATGSSVGHSAGSTPGGRRMFNGFGPTEATIMTNCAELIPGEPVSIGGAIREFTTYVLDARLRQVPPGVAGELYSAGAGLARGYHGRSGLSSERFVADPFGEPGTKMYRTGDIVRARANGSLDYLGRSDFQVKVRGFRIELGEIDAALSDHPSVRFAATIGHQLPDGSTALVAYVLPEPGAHVEPAELAEFAGRSLTGYMVPSEIIVIDAVPLTPVGKLDRAALPAPTIGTSTREYREPLSDSEKAVAAVLEDLLGAQRVGLDDSFFELGGNSLIATQVVARINAAVGARVGVREIFEAVSVGDLAARAEATIGAGARPVLEAGPRPDVLPLSFAQQRMWLTNQYDVASPAYNQPVALRMIGALNVRALEQAFEDLITRHESLRTVYPQTDDGPVQQIEQASSITVSLTPEPVDESDVVATLAPIVTEGFDVSAAIPFRARLFQMNDRADEYVLVVVMHHIASDGGSLAPLVRDLTTAYVARSNGAAPELVPLPVQYADYAIWQRNLLGDEDDPESLSARQISFWKTALAGTPEVIELPTDRPRPALPSARGETVRFTVTSDIVESLNAIARQTNSTLFMVVHAALAVLLSRLAATDDVSIGTQIGGRGEQALDDLVGMFGNTLVLRSFVSPDESFSDFLARTRTADLEALGNSDIALDRIVEILRPARSLAYAPLFQVLLMLQNFERTEIELPDVTIGLLDVDANIAKLDLTVTMMEQIRPDGSTGDIDGTLLYATDLFDRPTMDAVAERFVAVLSAIAADPSTAVGDLPLVTAGERAELDVLRGIEAPLPESTLVDHFRTAAAAHPDRTALIYAAGRPEAGRQVAGRPEAGRQVAGRPEAGRFDSDALTYAAFAERVSRLARHLVGLGVGPDTLVAVGARRSLELMIGLYAVLEAGGGYVPVDPDHPDERTEYVLASSNPVALLTTSRDRADLPESVPVIEIDTVDLSEYPASPVTDDERTGALLPGNVAYVIYTSGSTGRPKGVAVAHRSVVNQMLWMHETYDLGPSDVMLHKTPVTFDASVWELFLPLQLGATLVIARPEGHLDAAYLLAISRDHGVAILEFVPSMLELFLADESMALPDSLRYLSVGGEALSADLVRRFAASSAAVLDNTYGPTEATVTSTLHRTTDADTRTVPIGRPIRNTGARVLDSRLHDVPVGVPGELYLTGAQIARGYVGRADLTAERFVADPHAAGERMYRTGDLVTRTRAGELDFVGRTDFQVKLRGLRIELGEIESALSAHPDIARAVALVHTDERTGDALVAYVTTAAGTAPDVHRVLDFVGARLPAYMVPAQVLVIDEIPLSPSGKLDRRALPEPVFVSEAKEYRAPETVTEKVVADVFSALLDVERVSTLDSFFELGGNSLIGMRAVARINDALSVSVGVRDLFERPTVAALSARIDEGDRTGRARPALVPMERPERIPLSLAQQRMWFVNQFDTESAAYNIPLVIRLGGALDTEVLRTAVSDVLERHETLRTVYPQVDGTPYQVILPADAVASQFTVDSVAAADIESRVIALVTDGFDVSESVPVRGALLRTSATEAVLAFVVHHVSADGFSMGPLARDVMTAYASRIADLEPAWAPLDVQYADFSLWQRQMLGSETDPASIAAQQEAYWVRQLEDLPDKIDLPSDRPRPAVSTGGGSALTYVIGGDVHDRIDDLARAREASVFMVVHSALAVLLARLSGTEDIAIGAPIAGRGEEALDNLVGMFVNTLVLRTAVTPGESFLELLARAKAVDLGAFGNADVPFERLVEVLAPERSTSHNPLFQVALAFQNLERTRFELGDLTVERYDAGVYAAKFDLSIEVTETGAGAGQAGGRSSGAVQSRLGDLSVEVTYSTDLYDEPTIRLLCERFERVLGAVVEAPELPVGDISLLDDAQAALLSPVVGADPVEELTLAEILVAAAEANPDGEALVFEGGPLFEGESVSYRDLDAYTSQLARLLIERGMGTGSAVALSVPRSAESVALMWAVTKTGAAFVPIDPNYPDDRIAHMVTDSGVRVGLTTGSYRSSLPASIDWIVVDDDAVRAQTAAASDAPITDADRLRPVTPGDRAYIIYTSGSTGLPKGVTVSHRGLNQLGVSQRVSYEVEQDSRVMHFASPSFDASLLELLLAVPAAATMVIVPTTIFGGEELAQFLRRHEVTHAFITPAALASVDPAGLEKLQTISVGGEAYGQELVSRWALPIRPASGLPAVRRVLNVYGPTETTIVSHIGRPMVPGGPMPFGGPIRGGRAAVLDGRLRPVPIGVPGDLYTAGPGVALGYHERRALTSERFVADPYGAPGARMYRTGDVVRWTSDLELEYVGRGDSQIKIRGFRIEPGEIDAVVAENPEVRFSLTVPHETPSGAKVLVTYVTLADGSLLLGSDIKDFAAESLPKHMVPSAVVVLDSVPLGSTGKVDRRALPAPEFGSDESTFRAPQSEIEQTLATVFADVLGVDRVGADDDFFSLGGDSIVSIQLVSRARAAGLSLSPRDVFEKRTVAALAKVVTFGESAQAVLPEINGGGIGSRPLTPVERYMTTRGGAYQRFSQTVVLELPVGIDRPGIVATISAVVDKHDMLRARLVEDETGFVVVTPEPGSIDVDSLITRVDVDPALVGADLESVAREALDIALDNLSTANGVLLQFVWLDFGQAGGRSDDAVGQAGGRSDDTASDRSGRLIVAGHHLAVDGVSWRIIVPDLITAWFAHSAGTGQQLEPVGTSMRTWAHALVEEAATERRRAEIPFWRSVVDSADPLLGTRALDPAVDVQGTLKKVRVTVPAHVTSVLLTTLPQMFHGGVNDGLLAALALAVSRWRRDRGTDESSLLLRLEGHGREEDVPGGSDGPRADLSRTVGWFTSIFPVRLDLDDVDLDDAFDGGASAGRAVKKIKEQLLAVPERGVGYGILRYLDESGPGSRLLGKSGGQAGGRSVSVGQISFNYLGRVTVGDLPDGAENIGWLPASDIETLTDVPLDADMPAIAPLDINAIIASGKAGGRSVDGDELTATFAYPSGLLDAEDVDELSRHWTAALAALAEHATSGGAGGLTPSDVPLVRLSQNDIDVFEESVPDLTDVWSLAPLQAGLLFHTSMNPDNDVYVMQVVIDLVGAVDVDRFRAAAASLLDRYDILRAAFTTTADGTAVQLVPAHTDVPWVDIDLRDGSEADLRSDLEAERVRPFTMNRPPLVRFRMIRTGDDNYTLSLMAHHIVIDGWSMPLMIKDLLTLYATRADASILPAVASYRTFLEWLAARDRRTSVKAWTTAFAGSDSPTLLSGAADTAQVSADTGRLEVTLDEQTTTQLTELGSRLGVTLNTVVQTAWGLLLARSLGRDDVTFGGTVSGRPAELDGVESMVGLFINTLPVRIAIDESASIEDLLLRIQQEQTALLDHHYLGLADITTAVGPGAVFDTITVLESYPVDEEGLKAAASIDGMSVTGAQVLDATHYPISVVTFADTHIRMTLRYLRELFSDDEMARLGERLTVVFDAFANRSAARVATVDTLLPAERADLLSRRGAPDLPPLTLDALFAEAVVRKPSGDAVRQGDLVWTYRELDAKASQLARWLISQGAGPDTVVAVAVPRSPEFVLILWAVAKSGAYLVPIDPGHPADRIEYMLADSAATLGVTTTSDPVTVVGNTRWFALGDVEFDSAVAAFDDGPITDADRLAPIHFDNPAYMIYTSGSTGRPKGVVVSHRGLSNLVDAQYRAIGVHRDSRVLAVASTSFDASIFEILIAAGSSAPLVPAPAGYYGGPDLARFISDERISHIVITPSALSSMEPEDVPSVEVVMSVGEALPPELMAKWSVDHTVINGYGPAECTIMINVSDPLHAGDPITIGGPSTGVEMYVLDSRLSPVPVGVPGELYAGGPGVARGYFGRPSLTSERFVAAPYGVAGARLYRTGDVVRWTPAGTIEYVGRSDFQVKIRGQRIELGEIDGALTAHPDVEFAVTVGHRSANGVTDLVSYVVPSDSGQDGVRSGVPVDLDVAALHASVRETLPAHMVPALIMPLAAIPLNPVGKLDRRALPEPPLLRRQAQYRAPQTPEDQAVAEVFAELLGVEQVGVDDSFFDLGGNSLMATQAVARINAALDTHIGVRDIFDAETVGDLAARALSGGSGTRLPLVPQERPTPTPLSLAQRRMWFLNQFDTSSPAYNIPLAVRLDGHLDTAALERAVVDVLARHETLRTVYPGSEDGPYQVILQPADVPLDLTPHDVDPDDLIGRLFAFIAGGFDVTAGVPVRGTLLKLGADEHVLAIVVHHISADGFSLGPLARDVMVAYTAEVRGEVPAWSPLPVQYADFALWQRKVLGSDTDPNSLTSKQIAYWKSQLAGLDDALELPMDRPRPAVQSLQGGSVRFSVPAESTRALSELAASRHATLFMAVHAAFAVLLAKLAGRRDIAVGTPIAGRGEQELDNLVGMFVNTLALRLDVDPDASFLDLVAAARGVDLAAFGHADVPFEQLVEAVDPRRSTAYSPIFQVGFSFQNLAPVTFELPDLTIGDVGLEAAVSQFDLHLIVSEDTEAGSMEAVLTFAEALFDRSTAEVFANRFVRVVDAIVADPDARVRDIDVLDSAERQSILYARNDTALTGAPARLTDMFDARVAENPDGAALSFGEDVLTYAEFASRVRSLARYLIESGLGTGDLVALAIPRSFESMIAMYAIVTAGAAYLPIDLDHPAERTEYVLSDAAPTVALTLGTEVGAAQISATLQAVDITTLDLSQYSTAEITDDERVRALHADDLAYVIYTSGSTGRPKGVALPHRAVANQMHWIQGEFALTADDAMIQKTPSTFDLSVWELWWPLTAGATLVLATPDGNRDPAYLARLTREKNVTVADFVPSLLAAFVSVSEPEDLASLRAVLCIGEALPRETVDAFGRVCDAPVFNLYGPTEAAVSVTSHRTVPGATGPVPIGAPEANVRVYVLDERLRPVPAGVAGELYLAGDQLARGYFGNAALTAERFVADPFQRGRLYRTGDVVRWDGGQAGGRSGVTVGELVYLDRSDSQVKVRGFRIELGEVEAALTASGGVASAAAAVKKSTGGEVLVGYVVPEAETTLDVDQVRADAGTRVPAYMVPARIVVLDALPLSANGKLDRRLLPSVDVSVAREYRAPSTPVEEIVAAAFAAVLGVERVGVDDDFFELGGNSLSATQVVARVNARLGTRVGIREMFESANVAAFAARAETAAQSGPRAPLVPTTRPDDIPLSLAQQRMWFLNQFDTSSPAYNVPLAVRLEGELDVDALKLAVADVIERHESLRTVYPGSDAGPHQVILAPHQVHLDLTVEAAAEEFVAARLFTFVQQGFDVTETVPVRGLLLEVTPTAGRPEAGRTQTQHVLGIVIHHVSADGFSQGPLARDVMIAYTARAAGDAPQWTPLPVQYADFALWQRTVLGTLSDPNSVVSRQVDFWRGTLAGLGDALVLPTDRPRPAVQSLQGGSVHFRISEELTTALGDVARDRRATLFMAMHAAWSVLLGKLGGTRDIAVGTPIAGRGEQELDDMVGMFVNTLALRLDVDPDVSFADLVERARGVDLDAFGNADVPFEQLVEALNPVRSTAYHPIFQVGFSFQNLSPVRFELPGLTVGDAGFDFDVSQFDLHLIVSEDDEQGQIAMLTYATSLFDRSTAEVFVERFLRLLEAVAATPTAPIREIDVLSTAERASILVGRNDTAVGGVPQLLTEMFDARVAGTPDAAALTYEDRTLTYAEFGGRVAALARYLVESGVGTSTLVALNLPRSIDLMVAMYAVVTAGGAYLPIDPDHPAERTQYVLTDAAPSLVLTADLLDSLDLSEYSTEPVTDADRLRSLHPDDLAYVIYTSGSTGRPKGVGLPHRAVANQMHWMQGEFAITGDDAMIQKTPATFDLSVWELWWPLTAGARLVLATPDGNRDPSYLARLTREQNVTVADFVPSLLSAFVAVAQPDDLESLRAVLCIGEALPRDVVEAFGRASDAPVFNLYGPTEAAVSVTSHRTSRGSGAVPIGLPEANVQVYVLDDRLQPVPAGVGGELYLGGTQLARGYFGRGGLTAERFVANPFGGGSNGDGRLYRTGDAVRWTRNADGSVGELVFLDRTDTQVKVRGFRIELGEIESVLAAAEFVSAAAVAVKSSAGGDMLVGYVVPEVDSTVDVDMLRDFAATRLPGYMVPARLVILDALPLSVNGKLDRRALPSVTFDTTRTYRAPSTPVEEVVADAFASVLTIDRVGVDDNFFELGGNSLSATQVIARVNARLSARIGIREIFEAPTVSELAARAEHAVEFGTAIPLVPRPRPEIIPLSLAQQRMWFMNQFDPTSAAFNIPFAIRLDGALDADLLAQAITDVLGRHESLRTVYPNGDDGPHQVIVPVDDVALDMTVDTVDEADLRTRLFAFVTRGFDVTDTVPIRGALLHIRENGEATNAHVLAFVIHHVSADGFSLGPLARDVMVAYSSRLNGNAPVWTPLPVQYADYSLWQRDVLGTAGDPDSVMSKQLDFWRSTLSNLPGPLELPMDRPRPSMQSLQGSSVRFAVPVSVTDELRRLGRERGVTLFMSVHAAFSILLAKLSGTEDISVGTPIAGRGEQALDDLVGQFANTLALRSTVDPDATFEEMLAATRNSDLAAFGNADVPFEQVVEAVDPERSTAYHPIFQVGFSFQNLAPVAFELPGLVVSDLGIDAGIAQFDLHLVVGDDIESTAGAGGPGLDCVLMFAHALFERPTVDEFARRFVRVLETVVSDPSIRVRDIEILDETERGALVVTANDTAAEITDATTLIELFERQVAANPDATALVFENESLSYGQLAERVGRLARHLTTSGVGPGDLVAVAVPRSFDLIVAIYAIESAGAAYLPIALEHPAERTAYVLADASPSAILSVSDSGVELADSTVARIDVDTLDLSGYDGSPVTDLERTRALDPEDLAYVIYTSGSTGRPKGVGLPHRAVVNQMAWMTAEYGLSTADAMIQKTPPTFDLSVWELWWPLVSGARLVLAVPNGHTDASYLARLTREQNITVADFVPSLLAAFASVADREDVASIRQVLCIGEALSRDAVDAFSRISDAPVDNLYGPTEAAVSVTRHRATTGEVGSVPIGTPEANVRAYVLDSRLRPVPTGVTGELYLAGIQLARGYFGRSSLTAERFVADPFGTDPNGRMYRTGDAATWNRSGELDYVARTDDQVKVRGFRIELGEVESVLASHPSVAAAAAAVKTIAGSPALIGYLVPAADATVDVDEVVRYLASQVPTYMVPSRTMVVAELPLSFNGKLDRRALPTVDLAEDRPYREPTTPIEQLLVDAFAEVLGSDRIGVDDNFFELGGNSLSAMQLVGYLRKSAAGRPEAGRVGAGRPEAGRVGAGRPEAGRLGIEMPLQWVFTSPTPSGLASRLVSGAAVTGDDALGVVLPIRTTGTARPLFAIHPIVGLAWSYAGLAAHLDADIPLYGLQSPALSGEDALPDTLFDLADRYLAEIRAVQPEGPYRLLGWSLGGTIAHAIATTLRADGEQVELLAMLDSHGGPASEGQSTDGGALTIGDLLGAVGMAVDGIAETALDSFEDAARSIAEMPGVAGVVDRERVELMLRSAAHNATLLETHVPRVYDGDVVFFGALLDDQSGRRGADSWAPYVDGTISNNGVPTTHWSMTSEAALGIVGPVLARELS